jgi:hypothetical protein
MGYRKAKRRGGLAVHDHLEFCRKLHREIARLLVAQNAIDIGGGTTKVVSRVGCVGEQTAVSGIGRLPIRVRFADLRSVTRSATLDAPISATTSLAEIAEELVRAALAEHSNEKTITLVAISMGSTGRNLRSPVISRAHRSHTITFAANPECDLSQPAFVTVD